MGRITVFYTKEITILNGIYATIQCHLIANKLKEKNCQSHLRATFIIKKSIIKRKINRTRTGVNLTNKKRGKQPVTSKSSALCKEIIMEN